MGTVVKKTDGHEPFALHRNYSFNYFGRGNKLTFAFKVYVYVWDGLRSSHGSEKAV